MKMKKFNKKMSLNKLTVVDLSGVHGGNIQYKTNFGDCESIDNVCLTEQDICNWSDIYCNSYVNCA